MTNIGIIGAGIAGLQLGLFLRQHGIEATIYTDKTPAQMLAAQLSHLVVRFAPTRERERALGIDYWDAATTDLTRFSISIAGQRPLKIDGALDRPAVAVDMRIYCARLLEEFGARGGQVAIGVVQADQVVQIAARHDLVVVATGRGGLANMFARQPSDSPYRQPQRLAIAGFYRGIAYPQPCGYDLHVARGHGEIISLPLLSFEPGLTGLLIEAMPGGDFEVLRRMRHEDDPRRYHATVLDLLRRYAPGVYARVDPDAFELARPLDLAHAAITPTVRRGYARLANGFFAIALGDAHIVIDPLIGQGANTASHSAWVLGSAINDSQSFDQAFCELAERQMCAYALPVSRWSNARLGPPEPHVAELMLAASSSQAIADAYVNGANHPDWLWEISSSPEQSAAFLRQFGWHGAKAPAPTGQHPGSLGAAG